MKQMWNDRYSTDEYVYGKAPNAFFKTEIDQLTPGKILLPAEGEGRNAVYAASLGWEVTAVDQSEEGRNKAIKLAHEFNTSIQYDINDLLTMDYADESYDLIALTYVHLPSAARKQLHQKVIQLLKPNGILILEGFSIDNLKYTPENNASNGPKDPDFLFSNEIIKQELNPLSPLTLETVEIQSNEGKFHQGPASVVRYIGRKQLKKNKIP